LELEDMADIEPSLDQGESEGLARFIVPAVIVLVMAVAGWFTYKSLGGKGHEPKRQTVKIAVLPDTPPPPPPPPPKEKPPEPKEQENKPQPQEQQKPQETPPEPQQLKMDGPAGDGPSAFAAGSVNSEYKGGEVGTGIGGGPVDRMKFAFFTGKLSRHIQAALTKDPDLRFEYRLNVRIWINPAGRIDKAVLMQSTGDAQQDRQLEAALLKLPPIDSTPADLPQPATLRISNRLSG
jgi:protein TonB